MNVTKLRVGHRILCLVLCVTILSSGMVAFAGNNDNRATIAKNVDELHLYVYDLVQMMQNAEFNISKTVIKDDYFDVLTADNLLSVISGNDLLAALFGKDSYIEEKMDTVILNAVALDSEADKYVAVGSAMVDSFSYLEAVSEEIPFFDNVGPAVQVLGATTETSEMINKSANAYYEYLYALDIVVDCTDNKNVRNAARKVYKACTIDSNAEVFETWIKEYARQSAEVIVSEAINVLTHGIFNVVSASIEVTAGGEIETDINELYSMEFQNAVSNAFFDIVFDGSGSYLIRDYTEEELMRMKSLAALYLKTGYAGMKPNYPENAEACVEALEWLQTTGIPEESGISLTAYSVPGQNTDLAVGDKFVCFGQVSSEKKLSSVRVTVSCNGKTWLQASSGNINANEYNLLSLDSDLSFGTLEAGAYLYQVQATTEDGTATLLSESFQVTNSHNGCNIQSYRLPQKICEGGYFIVRGTVNAKSTIKSAAVEILDQSGTVKTGGTATVNSNSYNINRLDSKVVFGVLTNNDPDGYTVYRYRVRLVLMDGTEVVLVDQPFMVE